MPAISIISQPVTFVNTADLDQLKAALKEWGFQLYELEGRQVRDEESLFDQAAKDWPHPSYLTPHNWAALADCLWTALVENPTPKVVLLWTEAQNMLQGGLPVLVEGIDVVSSSLKKVGKNSKDPANAYYRLVVSGDGPNFPPLPAE